MIANSRKQHRMMKMCNTSDAKDANKNSNSNSNNNNNKNTGLFGAAWSKYSWRLRKNDVNIIIHNFNKVRQTRCLIQSQTYIRRH